MNINIKATNTTLTPSIKSNVESKLSVIEKFTRPEDVIYVELAEDTHHQSGMFFRLAHMEFMQMQTVMIFMKP